jgi:DNA-binding transcriptional MerR regulator
MTRGEPRWTIAELSERVSAALAEVEYAAPANGQVRAVPDLRTIRYYTTLGLLDRPAAMKGRTALYGRRHLLQLVAVKRLQAEGRSLSDVQVQLAGLDDRALARIARVPEAADRAPAPDADEAPVRREARFWAAAPARASLAAAAEAAARPRGGQVRPLAVTAAAKIQLAAGVSLTIESAGAAGGLAQLAGAIDAVALTRAAAPLLEALRRQGLIPEDGDHEEEDRG